MNKHLNTVLDIASHSTMHTRHGAIIVKGGKEVVCTGSNHHKCHMPCNQLSVHAEMDAIQRFIKG